MPTVYFQYANALANLMGPLARRFRDDLGIDVVLFCMTKAAVPDGGVHDCRWSDFSEIVEFESLIRHIAASPAPLPGLAERCARLESKHGVALLEGVRGDRHIGLGFNTTVRFPRSRFGLAFERARSIAAVCTVAEAIEQRIEADRPVGLVGMGAAFAELTLWLMADAMGVPCRAFSMARVGTAFSVVDRLAQWPVDFPAVFKEELAKADGAAASWMPQSHRATEAFAAMRQETGVRSLLRRLARVTLNTVRKRLARKPGGYGGYLLTDNLLVTVERWWHRRRAVQGRQQMPSIPPEQPFVFIPLHIEPESTLMVESPRFDNQWIMIDWVTKTVPAGWLVVVKEHPGATSPRPRWFWRALRKRPNVVVANPFEDAAEITRRARAVATINGSLGLQAATIGKPVLAFQPDYLGAIMDHVIVARDYDDTRRFFRRVLTDDLPSLDERLRSAAAFTRTVERLSIPITDPGLLSGRAGRGPVPKEDVERLFNALADSLGLLLEECTAAGPGLR